MWKRKELQTTVPAGSVGPSCVRVRSAQLQSTQTVAAWDRRSVETADLTNEPIRTQEQLPQDRGFAQNLAMGTRGRLCPLDSIGEPAVAGLVTDERDEIRVVLVVE